MVVLKEPPFGGMKYKVGVPACQGNLKCLFLVFTEDDFQFDGEETVMFVVVNLWKIDT